MVRPVHHHHGSEGTIGPCQCADPLALAPTGWPRTERMPAGETTTEDLLGLVRGVRDQQQRASRDRPPPTSYRDEQGRWHPGPGAEGYIEHLDDCRACCQQGERHALVRLRSQHIGPAAVAVGALS